MVETNNKAAQTMLNQGVRLPQREGRKLPQYFFTITGTLGSYFQLMVTVGILYVYVVGAFVSYRVLSIVCGVIPVIFLATFFSAPATPGYLLSKGRSSDAKASLKRLRGRSYDITYELQVLQKELAKSTRNKAPFSVLFTRKAAFKGLITSLGLMVFQQLSGLNNITFYANNIFKDAGSTLSPEVSSVIIGIMYVVFTYLASILVDKAGRRILLLLSAAVMGGCQGLLGFYFYLQESGRDVSSLAVVPLTSVALFIVLFSLGFGPIPWMMTGELFACDVKGPSSGIAVGLNWFLAFLVTKTFDPLKSLLGSGATFGMFGIICVLGVLFVFFLVPETKGKSLEEIQIILGGNKQRDKNLV